MTRSVQNPGRHVQCREMPHMMDLHPSRTCEPARKLDLSAETKPNGQWKGRKRRREQAHAAQWQMRKN